MSSGGLRSWLVSGAFIAATGVVAWYGTAYQAGTPEAQATESRTMAAPDDNADSTDAGVPDESSERLAGGLPTRVVVPSAGIEAAIDEVGIAETDAGELLWETAWRAAGHHLDSARPGELGNMILSGHVSVREADNVAVFANLSAVQDGDLVEVFSGTERFVYKVTEIRTVSPDEVTVLRNDHRARLTMITCTPDLVERLVVVASLVS